MNGKAISRKMNREYVVMFMEVGKFICKGQVAALQEGATYSGAKFDTLFFC